MPCVGSVFEPFPSVSPLSIRVFASSRGDLLGTCGVAECCLVADLLAGRCGGPAAIGIAVGF